MWRVGPRSGGRYVGRVRRRQRRERTERWEGSVRAEGQRNGGRERQRAIEMVFNANPEAQQGPKSLLWPCPGNVIGPRERGALGSVSSPSGQSCML